MKTLLAVSMLAASLLAQANVQEGWDVKCYEKGNHGLDLAYIVKADYDSPAFERRLELLDCTRGRGDHDMNNCRERGYLKKVERQEESCLVLRERNDHESLENGYWSLCHQEQETLENPRLVPVTVTDDRQESRIYCERSILRVL